jgi:hypothetical protein
MVRTRKLLREETRHCDTCGQDALFQVYKSWERVKGHWWTSSGRKDERISARCEQCGYRIHD